MIQMLLGSVMPGLFKLGDKLIEDKDQRNKFAFKTQEMTFKMMEVMLNTKTYPWVDALVKLSYASEQIIKGLFRPLGSFAMAGFAAYCQVNDITLPTELQYLLYGAPVGWGVSRHAEKAKKKKETEDDGWW